MSGIRITLLILLAALTAGHAAAVGSARPLPFFYDLYTFRGADGSTAIVSAFAVEAGRLEMEAADTSVQYRFSVSFVLADTALHSVIGTHDTVFVEVPRRMPEDHLLYTHVQVQARPSASTRQRVIMNDATRPGIGQLYTAFFPIPDYSGSELMLSDIALGQPDTHSGWTRGGVTLALLPTSQFPSSAFDVYYEIYNLAAGTPYSTEITIDHARDGDDDAAADRAERRPVSLRFSGVSGAAADASLPELRRVETSLSKGSYRLAVTITNLKTGALASRSRDFEVRGAGRGMTMVAATPVRGGPR